MNRDIKYSSLLTNKSGLWKWPLNRGQTLLTTQHKKKEFLLTSLLGKYFQSHIEWQTHSLSQEQVRERKFSKDLLSATNVSQSKNRNSNLHVITLAWTALKKHQLRNSESIQCRAAYCVSSRERNLSIVPFTQEMENIL